MPSSSPHMPPSPPELIERFERILQGFPALERRKMFGYPAAFVPAGHMVTGLHGERWVVRLGEDDQAELRAAGGSDFEPMPGRRMRGFLALPAEIVSADDAVGAWVERAAAFAATLPPKERKQT